VIHPSNARLYRFRDAILPDLWLFTLAAKVLLCGCASSTPATPSASAAYGRSTHIAQANFSRVTETDSRALFIELKQSPAAT
jgi:hypothetical protein